MSIVSKLAATTIVARANLRLPERPDRFPRAMVAMLPWGTSFAAGVAASAARYPGGVAVVDDGGSMTYSELWGRSNALTRGLVSLGVAPGARVGVLARNHADFVLFALAAAKAGTTVVFLNTAFAPPQLRDVVAGEGLDLVLHDDEFAGTVSAAAVTHVGTAAAVALVESHPQGFLRPPRRQGGLVVLTSGTTGQPKGASRQTGGAMEGVAPLLSRVPIGVRERTVVPAPLFHAWGLAHMGLALGMASTLVLQRAFDPEMTLSLVEEHRATCLAVVPLMLQRMLALDPQTLVRYDTSSLRIIACGGSPLSGRLAVEVLNRFGPVLYNVYGSTEVSTATVATPRDLRDAPGTVGRVAPGCRVEVLDDAGEPVPAGRTGRIFVGNPYRFEGYTTGGSKEVRHGLLSSGDMGHFDSHGRLYIDGRDDDMIVSGAENVYPAEVEELLSGHPAVAEVTVLGISDAEFGQALKAFVVRRPGVELDEEEVRAYVRDRLARYKVPRQVAFVDHLPRTATGKVVKRMLPS